MDKAALGRRCSVLFAIGIFWMPILGDNRLFADLKQEDLLPRDSQACLQLTTPECLVEYHHKGRFEGSQQHRTAEQFEQIAAQHKLPHARLLVMITTVWRNFQRRRLLRNSLIWCRRTQGTGAEAVWRFVLGDLPKELLHQAMEELDAYDDMMLLGGVDEMEYSHLGDVYELQKPNPELRKIIKAIRRLRQVMTYDYLLVADDDSFINLPNAIGLTHMLPPERVYVGNMIDTIPQRFSKEHNAIMVEYTVSLYLHTSGKVPIFAHGLGFLISRDIADMLGDLGLSMKMRGNDDMLFGVWLRGIERLHYLHYWIWFHDHEEFEGAFSKPCDYNSIVVHRMTPERWRTFNKMECHICGPGTLEPLDVQPGERDLSARKESRKPESRGSAGLARFGAAKSEPEPCLAPTEIGCRWAAAKRSVALHLGLLPCSQRCKAEAVWHENSSDCPASVCLALCRTPGPRNSLCPQGSRKKHRIKPVLAILIFGSRWTDMKLRRHLRNSLKACSSQRLGVVQDRAAWLFVMTALPSQPSTLRQAALREVLLHDDIMPAHTRHDATATYSYAEGWQLVEEHFGGADYVLYLDHRSYVNIPFILHGMIPELDRTNVLQGCLIDETLFGPCDGKGTTRCDYLWRRRAPLFPHGMGFLVSQDVAKFISDMRSHFQLREADVPADVAFGTWIQSLEDLDYDSVHEYYHELPLSSGGMSDGAVSEFRQPLSDSSAVAWPMNGFLWRSLFNAQTCTLEHEKRGHSNSSKQSFFEDEEVAGEVEQEPRDADLKALASRPTHASQDDMDCWSSMGGRGEAWYLVCCEIGWSGCWGGDFTETSCCKHLPASSVAVGTALQPSEKQNSLDALARFLNFSDAELNLLLLALGNASSSGSTVTMPGGQRFRCLTPNDCAKEAFARFYQSAWAAGFAPLRHPWMVDREDYLFGLQVKLRMENDGWGPKGHEHTMERVQLGHFLGKVVERVPPEAMPAQRRCLEWDSGAYSRHYFKKHCDFFDVVTYMGDDHTEVREGPNKIDYFVDIHLADRVVAEGSAGMVVCAQIFEHLRQPFVAMQQLFRWVAPGGYVAWSAPLFSEIHGAPQDYWRFTPSGAKVLAEEAGFHVLELYAPGGLQLTAGYLLGLTSPYWRREALLDDHGSSWPLQVYMLLQKPSST